MVVPLFRLHPLDKSAASVGGLRARCNPHIFNFHQKLCFTTIFIAICFTLRNSVLTWSINYGASDMSNNIIETNLGKKVDLQRISEGSASPITKSGAFYVFSLRVAGDDVREYSFTNRDRAVSMRSVLVSHLTQKMQLETKKKVI